MLPVCMVLSLSCLSYLSLASGGGVLERGGQWGVRKVGSSTLRIQRFEDLSLDRCPKHPQNSQHLNLEFAMLNPTSFILTQVFAARIGAELITCPIAVWFCSRLVHAPRGMRDIFLFSSFMMTATLGCASLAIPSASRWLFWGLSWVFLVVTLVGMYKRFMPLAMRRFVRRKRHLAAIFRTPFDYFSYIALLESMPATPCALSAAVHLLRLF